MSSFLGATTFRLRKLCIYHPRLLQTRPFAVVSRADFGWTLGRFTCGCTFSFSSKFDPAAGPCLRRMCNLDT